ncbi:hypothetical protein AKJ63_01620 [candidate division MSBL1 archaeon SCGC-AAA259D18]|uniref:Uncharacterized protein n=1 Tax=candidate division MSBL1 archaeon SCGC-AAA259D18 TaxID=1698262 RepID=A0A133UAV5_9EURY|nr:hypothetical protein AKJ63_01620 [candidate division MSBL1 archaeon SCGC-AAA259D18]
MEKGSWIHEFFLERVPPFSLLSHLRALILQLVIMEIIGVLCVIVFFTTIQKRDYGVRGYFGCRRMECDSSQDESPDKES